MTIDEAIAKCKDITNTDANCPRHCMRPCDECVQECGQVLEWLEELKTYREIGTVQQCKNSVLDTTKAYNKAIDDFVNECICYEHLVFEQEHIERMQAIAEQLKAGVNNGTDNQ